MSREVCIAYLIYATLGDKNDESVYLVTGAESKLGKKGAGQKTPTRVSEQSLTTIIEDLTSQLYGNDHSLKVIPLGEKFEDLGAGEEDDIDDQYKHNLEFSMKIVSLILQT